MNTVTRILLGLPLVIFGLNGFFHFIPTPPVEGLSAQFLGAMFGSSLGYVVKFLELVGGLMLLFNFYSRLALLFITPITVMIVLFHICIAGGGLFPLPIILLILNILQIRANKDALTPFLKRKSENLKLKENLEI